MSQVSGDGGDSKSKEPRMGSVARTLTRIVAYYVVFLGAAAALFWAFPELIQVIAEAGGEPGFTGEVTNTFAGVPEAEPMGPRGWTGVSSRPAPRST